VPSEAAGRPSQFRPSNFHVNAKGEGRPTTSENASSTRGQESLLSSLLSRQLSTFAANLQYFFLLRLTRLLPDPHPEEGKNSGESSH